MPDFRVPELSIDSTPVQRHNTSIPTPVHTDASTTTNHQDAPTVTMPTTMSATKPGPKPISTIKRPDTSGYVSKIKPPQTGTMPVVRKNSKPTLDPADKAKTTSSVQSVQSAQSVPSTGTDLIDEPLPADPDKALALIISRTNMTDVNSLAKSLVAVLHWMDRFAQMIESMDASGQARTQSVPTDGITARDIARMLHDKVDMMTERLVGIDPDESNKRNDQMRAKMNTIMAERRKADRDNQMMSLLGTLDTIAQQTDAYTDPNLTQVMLEMMQRMNEGR